MGVPQEDRVKLFEWSNRMIGAGDPEFMDDQAGSAMAELFMYSNSLAEKRREDPRDDIVTKLLNAEIDGDKLSELEFDMFMLLLSVAGNETTRNAATGGMLALLEHPEQWERLKADRSLVRTAADEIVRWVTPVNMFRRTAVRDVELRGKKIAEGDKVVVFYSSATRDEAVFADPWAFDVGRDPNPHIGFGGGGPHFCLGANLARAEMRVMLQEVVDRLGDFEVDGPVRRLRSNFINGIKHLPVAWEAP
jgi:cholest-4-en-3-one 26-monooxygenase